MHNQLESLIPSILEAAQHVYDEWLQEDGFDEDYGEGGICHDIADDIATVLSHHDIDCVTAQAAVGENHTYVVCKLNDGVYTVDIPPYIYEIGSGYTWKKIENVKFKPEHLDVSKIDSNPDNFSQYSEELDEELLPMAEERKFEKIKLAREILKSKGHNKAFARNPKGKYLWSPKDVRAMMRKMGLQFSRKDGKWLPKDKIKRGRPRKTNHAVSTSGGGSPSATKSDKPVNDVAPEVAVLDIKNVSKATSSYIIWTGSAAPWHKGHDQIIESIKSSYSSVSSNILVILLRDTTSVSLIKELYKEDTSITVATDASDGSLESILAVSSKYGKVVGWASKGSLETTETHYNEWLKANPNKGFASIQFINLQLPAPEFDPLKYINAITHDVESSETSTIDTNLLSSKLLQELAKKVTFEKWIKEVTSTKDEIALIKYKELYSKYSQKPESVMESFKREVTLKIKNILNK